jgi:hypothetical protein
MSFELNKKVALLNKLTNKSLTITYYTAWELSSYEKNSLFTRSGLIGPVRAEDFTECIDKAFKLVREEIANG